jgi:hypothetical protein
MKDLKHLKTFEQYSLDVDTSETNEGLFGMNKEQKQLITDLAAKGKLEDADIDNLIQNKLIGSIVNSFNLSNPNTKSGDIAIAKKNEFIKNPKSQPDVLFSFIKAYNDALVNAKLSKIYSVDPKSGKLYAKTGNMSNPTGLMSAVGGS